MKKEFKFSYEHVETIAELTSEQRTAIEAAENIRQHAYVPYSHFKVGAALLLNNGEIIQGCNQENKAFPAGLCAERVALFSYGAKKDKSGIKILAITGEGDMLEEDAIFSPCGSCRQVMAEFVEQQKEPFEIVIQNGDGSFMIFEGVHQLLPFIFGKNKK